MSAPKSSDRTPRAWLLPFLLAGTYLRVAGIWRMPLFGDERHGIEHLGEGWSELWSRFDAYGTHVAYPLLEKTSVELFGRSAVALRLPAVVAGVAALWILYPIARRFVGAAPAFAATAWFALNPMHVYYSRFARPYAVAVLLALVLAWLLERASDERTGRPATWAAAALLAGLLPFVHLSSLGFVAAVELVALVRAWRGPRRPAARRWATATPVAAGLVCAALYLPAWPELRAFAGGATGLGAGIQFPAADSVGLLAGGPRIGLFAAAVLPLAWVGLFRARRPSLPWLAAAVLGPFAALAITRPYGAGYAYARYLLLGLPFAAMALAWLLEALIARWNRAAAPTVTRWLGALVAAVLFLTGPLSPARPDDEPFSNTYLALRELPAYDAPFPDTPAFYGGLAGERIVEAPPLDSRSALLYRNYALQHDAEVLVGRFDDALGGPPAVRVFGGDLEACGASYLVVHLDLAREVADYWRFVHGPAWRAVKRSADRGLLRRHRDYPPPPATKPRDLARLRERYGAPCYEDGVMAVWKLR